MKIELRYCKFINNFNVIYFNVINIMIKNRKNFMTIDNVPFITD